MKTDHWIDRGGCVVLHCELGEKASLVYDKGDMRTQTVEAESLPTVNSLICGKEGTRFEVGNLPVN